jgi:hypothetical protein
MSPPPWPGELLLLAMLRIVGELAEETDPRARARAVREIRALLRAGIDSVREGRELRAAEPS